MKEDNRKGTAVNCVKNSVNKYNCPSASTLRRNALDHIGVPAGVAKELGEKRTNDGRQTAFLRPEHAHKFGVLAVGQRSDASGRKSVRLVVLFVFLFSTCFQYL